MLRTRNITLSSTIQQITIPDAVDAPNAISIQNTYDTGYAYLGGASVSSTNYGVRLAPGQIFSADLSFYDKIYAVGDTGVTIAVLVIERA